MTQPSLQLKQNLAEYGVTCDEDANVAQALIDRGVPESGLIDAVRKYGPGIFAFLKLILGAFGVDASGWQAQPAPQQHGPPAPAPVHNPKTKGGSALGE